MSGTDLLKALPVVKFTGDGGPSWEDWCQDLISGLELSSREGGALVELLEGAGTAAEAYAARAGLEAAAQRSRRLWELC